MPLRTANGKIDYTKTSVLFMDYKRSNKDSSIFCLKRGNFLKSDSDDVDGELADQFSTGCMFSTKLREVL